MRDFKLWLENIVKFFILALSFLVIQGNEPLREHITLYSGDLTAEGYLNKSMDIDNKGNMRLLYIDVQQACNRIAP